MFMKHENEGKGARMAMTLRALDAPPAASTDAAPA
jgi:hypothetical protein